MRSFNRSLIVLACVLVGCGTTAPGGGSGSGGAPDGGGIPDGGVADAGNPGGGVDAGMPGGGNPDAGTPDAGGGGGGGSASDCDGLGPRALPAMVTHSEEYSTASEATFCNGLPLGMGNGYVGYKAFSSGHPVWTLLSPAGESVAHIGAWRGDAFPGPNGFVLYSGSSTQQMVVVVGYSSTGKEVGRTAVNGSAWFAGDPDGGMLAVGYFNTGDAPSNPPANQMIEMFNADGTVRWGPFELGSNAPVVGTGIDTLGHALVLVDSGSGNIDGIWYGAGGAPSTKFFRVVSGFQAGPSTWFETSPLIGGGLALRRMDAPASGDERRTSQWLLVLPSGEAKTEPAPAWLAQRPDTNMQLARTGAAYAFLPWSADASSCDQQVEIVSPKGNSCGRADFRVDDNACRTRELRLGLDGTVLQMLPADRETTRPGTVVRTCTLRYWPAALR